MLPLRGSGASEGTFCNKMKHLLRNASFQSRVLRVLVPFRGRKSLSHPLFSTFRRQNKIPDEHPQPFHKSPPPPALTQPQTIYPGNERNVPRILDWLFCIPAEAINMNPAAIIRENLQTWAVATRAISEAVGCWICWEQKKIWGVWCDNLQSQPMDMKLEVSDVSGVWFAQSRQFTNGDREFSNQSFANRQLETSKHFEEKHFYSRRRSRPSTYHLM